MATRSIAKSLDEAIALASGFFAASDMATIDVRPIVDFEAPVASP